MAFFSFRWGNPAELPGYPFQVIQPVEPSLFFLMGPGEDGGQEAPNECESAITHSSSSKQLLCQVYNAQRHLIHHSDF